MGGSLYDGESRSLRSKTMGFHSKGVDEIFTQNTKRVIHADMNPNGIIFRESRDSEVHPLTVPIQLYLDVTGSMRHIPHDMIKEGLPTLMSNLIQKGVPDAALMFGAIGDHECDRAPLQVAQFESGDAELDMWLTRAYLEGGGGGNAGESYLLAWYFAANHIKTDAWEKRMQKGFVFTIGDEPNLHNLPVSAVKGIMGDSVVGQGNFTDKQLLAAAQKTNHVFHIHVDHGNSVSKNWKDMLGQNLLIVTDYTLIPNLIVDTVLAHKELQSSEVETEVNTDDVKPEKPKVTL